MISVFTPSHNPKYLDEAYKSLADQDHKDWEWVVLLNNGAEWTPPEDARVKVYRDSTNNRKVGYLKMVACGHATGDILVELDHDDLLVATCLSKLQLKFDSDPSIVFVYSNSVNVDMSNMSPIYWAESYGWTNRPYVWEGRKLIESVSSEPDPQSISRIWFAPNHVRAWRTKAYRDIGGHDPSFNISDDHDIMLRTYLYGKMVHIDEPLYIYRVHGDNTWLKNTQEIHDTMWTQHDKYIGALALKWAERNKLRAIDICSGPKPPQGYEGVDLYHGGSNGIIRHNLNDRWPFHDSSVGVVRAFDAIEHLRDPIHTMNEAYRVLAHGGMMLIHVPSTRGEGAWCDPTHVSFWNRRSFSYYTDPKMRSFIEPMARCKFQAMKVTDFEMYGVPFVSAHLIAIKDGGRFYGEFLWD